MDANWSDLRNLASRSRSGWSAPEANPDIKATKHDTIDVRTIIEPS